MVYTIAKDTGWSEEWIMWKLPLARAMQYYHCALQAAGLWTLEPGGVNTSEEKAKISSLMAHVDSLQSEETPPWPTM